MTDRLLIAVVPRLAALLIRLIRRTMRIDFVGEEHPRAIWERGERLILTFWHDQLLLMVTGYRGPGAAILISASRDGELIARTMHCFGLGTVRGSSSRGGRAAFREMLEIAREPVDLAMTPDGPKGPRHQVKDGVVQLARLAARPVVPLAFACSRGRRFSSWDRFLLPYPFGRGVFSFGAPLYYGETDTPEAFRARVQTAMEANLARAQDCLRANGLSAV